MLNHSIDTGSATPIKKICRKIPITIQKFALNVIKPSKNIWMSPIDFGAGKKMVQPGFA